MFRICCSSSQSLTPPVNDDKIKPLNQQNDDIPPPSTSRIGSICRSIFCKGHSHSDPSHLNTTNSQNSDAGEIKSIKSVVSKNSEKYSSQLCTTSTHDFDIISIKSTFSQDGDQLENDPSQLNTTDTQIFDSRSVSSTHSKDKRHSESKSERHDSPSEIKIKNGLDWELSSIEDDNDGDNININKEPIWASLPPPNNTNSIYIKKQSDWL